jgi:hypothetical protein
VLNIILDTIGIITYMPLTSSHSRARSRALKCGDGGETALEIRRRALRVRSLFSSPALRGRPGGGQAGAVAVAGVRSARRGGPSRGVPMRRRARMDRWVGLSPKYYGAGLKSAAGGLAEQASNTARGTPDVSALRDCYLLCTK